MKWAVILLLCLSGCTNESATINTLESMGFTHISITGWRLATCGQDDMSSTGFVAKNPQGREVAGVVCCGMFKGCTVRF